MNTAPHDMPAERRSYWDRRSERSGMRRLFLLIYPLCIAQATTVRIVRLLGGRSKQSQRSVLAEARSAANAAVGYAFHA